MFRKSGTATLGALRRARGSKVEKRIDGASGAVSMHRGAPPGMRRIRAAGWDPLGMTRMRRPAALLPLGLAALGLAGCTTGFSYISRNYVALTPQVVTIGCKEPYEVYDNRQLRRMLIVSNALREYTGCNLSEVRIDPEPDATRVKRFRTAARAYLDETVREDCRITGETVFDPLKTEFAYACDAPIEKRGTVVPRLPGRNPGLGVR